MTQLETRPGPTAIVWRTLLLDSNGILRNKSNQAQAALMDSNCERHGNTPDPDCGCGLYAYYEAIEAWLQRTRNEMLPVLARCTYYGTTIVGERGVRTQHIKLKRVYIISDVLDASTSLVDLARQQYPTVEVVCATGEEALTILAS